VKAGGALRYMDNGNGTITDLNTGLVWEKKVQDGGLHDWSNKYEWSCLAACAPMELTIWDWLDFVNAEGGVGFAGHNDWRIPNVKELQSIVDYGVGNSTGTQPTVAEAFNNGVAGFCDALSCSRTQPDVYWSSSTLAAAPVAAWGVFFNFGFVSNVGKTGTDFVRAVRGGCVPV
jgi:hypothetical protein